MTFFLPKKMKYFMVTMELKNFSKAAEELCITRSLLSKVIYEMEEYFGGKLFRRTYNDLEPTDLAIDLYSRIKPLYLSLLEFEKEFNRNEVKKHLNIIFDISFPKLLYKHMLMAINSHGIRAECRRCVIDYNETNNIHFCNTDLIISAREIPEQHGVSLDKWKGGEYVLISPDSWISQNKGNLYVWKDAYTGYIKEKVIKKFPEIKGHYEFTSHNYDITTLLYNIRIGHGCVIMPHKLSLLHKMDNTITKILKSNSSTIYFYRRDSLKNNEEIQSIKMLINQII